MKNDKIVFMKLEDIKPYENNPRNNDDAVDMVAKSIAEFGFQNPIIVDKNNVVIAGHTRLKASYKLGLKEAPVIVADDLTEDQANAYRLVDNKTAEISEWNIEKLEEELKNMNIDMQQYGFEDIELHGGILDDFFAESEAKTKEPKKIQCPHCGEWFEL